MGFFARLAALLRAPLAARRRDAEWNARFNEQPPAPTVNTLLPLEPEKDPWRR